MKRFLFLVISSVLMGMLGAYVTTASAANWLPSNPACAMWPVVTCCVPDGKLYCNANGNTANSCGDVIDACVNNQCDSSGGPYGAQCTPGAQCTDNGARSCLDPQRVKNNCWEVTETCGSDQVCSGWACVAKAQADCGYSCDVWGNLGNQCGWYIECPFGCDGSTKQCKAWVCASPLAEARICSPWWHIENWCGERVQDCPADNPCYKDANTHSCSCGKPDVGDPYSSYQCVNGSWNKVWGCNILTNPVLNLYSNGAYVCGITTPVSGCQATPQPWKKYQCTSVWTWKLLTNQTCSVADYLSSKAYGSWDVVCVAAGSMGNNCVVPNGSNMIGNKIWIDNNKDWLQDEDSANDGVGEMIVELRSCASLSVNSVVASSYNGSLVRSTVAAHKWDYLFENIPAGKYYVHFRLRKGVLEWTTQWVGTEREKDSDVDPSTDKTKCFQIAANETNISIDAWVILPDNVRKCASLSVGQWPSHISDNPPKFDWAWNELKVWNYASLRPVEENPFMGNLWEINFACIGVGNDSIPGDWFKIYVYDDKGNQLQMKENQWNAYNFTQPWAYKVECRYGGHTYQYCQKDLIVWGWATMWTYVWHDKNKDGLQDERSTSGVPNVVLKLYQCGYSVRWIDQSDWANNRNMPSSYSGTYVKSVLTKANGSYQFTGLNPSAYYYVQMDQMPVWFSNITSQFTGGYSTYGEINSNMNPNKWNNVWWRTTCELPEAFVDIGLIKDDANVDLVIAKQANKSEFINQSWQVVTWTIAYVNRGPGVAKNVVIRDILPQSLMFVSASSWYQFIAVDNITGQNCGDPAWNCRWHYVWEIGSLNPWQTGSIMITTRYWWWASGNTVFTNYTDIATQTPETNTGNNTANAKTKVVGVVSCDALNMNMVSTVSSWQVLRYHCLAQNASTVRFNLRNSSNALVYSSAMFTGEVFNLPMWLYTGTCVVDGSIDYSVQTYHVAGADTCSIKSKGTSKCAVKSNTAALINNPVPNINKVTLFPAPVVYCSDAQVADSSWSCAALTMDDYLLTRKDTSCMGTGIRVWSDGRIGDFVRNDANKDGIQDASEWWISGVWVWLYTCDSTPQLIKSTTTNASGLYLFDGLVASGYRVKFAMPAAYNTYTKYMVAGSTSANDSNAGSDGFSPCITLTEWQANLTVDAGVYYVGGIGCPATNLCCNGCGPQFCGDHTVSNRIVPGTTLVEQCDEGLENGIPWWSCDRFCQNTWTPPWGWVSTGRVVTFSGLQMWYVDPPDVMVWEYVPFWWQLSPDEDVVFVNSCEWITNGDANKRYIIWAATTDPTTLHPDGLTCEFQLFNSTENWPRILRTCNLKKLFDTSELTSTYLSRRNSPTERISYANANGASVIFPADWWNSFTKLGEYGINRKSITFSPCQRVEEYQDTRVWWVTTRTVTSVKYVKLPRHIYRPAGNNIFRMTVSQPYVVQKNGLSTSSLDSDVITRIVNSSNQSIIPSITKTNYNLSESTNIGYLTDSFVKKYSALATQKKVIPWLWEGNKVGNNEIYIYEGNQSIFSTTNLGNKTIIVRNGNLTIRGSLRGNVMFIVPDWSIIFEQLNSEYDNTQEIEGIYVAKAFDTNMLWNNDLDKWWRFDGRLVINGMIASLNTTNTNLMISNLRNKRRSVLRTWFNLDSLPTTTYQTRLQKHRVWIVTKWWSLTIANNPSLWTNLPPGANELMTALQAFK